MKRYRHAHILSSLSSLILFPMMVSPLYGGELPAKCRLVPVNGPCKAIMDKYYFDQKTARCTEYIYDGCGPVVPFEKLEECQALCENVKSNGKQEETTGYKPGGKSRSGLAYDPVEDDPRYAEVFKTIDDEVSKLLAVDTRPRRRGFVNIFWSTKKDLLKRKYGIDWRSPGEMNPDVIFD